jgi:hypothetical protein
MSCSSGDETMQQQVRRDSPAIDSTGRPPAPVPAGWRFATVQGHERPRVEHFIQQAYAQAYGARLTAFMPQLAAVLRDGVPMAACGLRRAGNGRLYLETYLDQPVEQRIAAVVPTPVLREHVVEIGNLAIARPGAARVMIALLTAHLAGEGMRWAVFTAVPALRNNFTRLAIPLHALGRAAPERLDDASRAQWGRYYDASPQVVAVRVADAQDALGGRP